jgi:hypothetical protein
VTTNLTQRETVKFYNPGGDKMESIDKLIKPLELNNFEIDSLVGFLNTLMSETKLICY